MPTPQVTPQDPCPCRACVGGGCREICEVCEDLEEWASRKRLQEQITNDDR